MISTRGRYAVRVMIDLAENRGSGSIPLRDIAERQEISKKYLEIIMRDLVEHGMVSGTSGKKGGYRLTRDPSEYTILSIIEAAEGPLAPVACLQPDAEECPRAAFCKTLPMWKEYYSMIDSFFSGRYLSDLIADTVSD